MAQTSNDDEPDWDIPLSFSLSPAAIIHTLFASADTVHTGWGSCVDHTLVVADSTALDETGENHCRFVEQEYVEDEEPELTWHDWAVELKLGELYVTGHWRASVSGSPSDWDWCVAEAENAFSSACILVGRRVRKGLVIEDPSPSPRAPRTHH